MTPSELRAKTYMFRGQRMAVSDVRKLTGWSDHAVRSRIVGDTIEDRPLVPRSKRRASAIKTFLFRGETLTVAQIAERTGRAVSWVYKRISGNEVLEHPPVEREMPCNSTPIYFAGERLPPHGWAKLLGIPTSTLYNRINAGWPVKRTLTERPRTAKQRAIHRRNQRLIHEMIEAFRGSDHANSEAMR